ncbi:putative transcription repressor NiaR [Lachnospiraceae bacterium]|uniref:transcription repressor NadR n=1 Tax=Candidatus Merdisoma sp. JLR.KK011 TaxID=3114299 RepID=UPI00143531C5|nr:putative transcription repressor NiaR [Lachnospiraceae bacterium]
MEKPLDGERRREEIIRLLAGSRSPVSGTELARRLKVSRQVIVQDVALLRAVNKNILSTNKGYLLFEPGRESGECRKTLCVRHTTEQVLEEFYGIVDLGGKILDVVVEHELYGQIAVDLIIASRQDAEEFYQKMRENRAKPLKELTEDVHYHTIVAKDAASMERIERVLEEKGFLLAG